VAVLHLARRRKSKSTRVDFVDFENRFEAGRIEKRPVLKQMFACRQHLRGAIGWRRAVFAGIAQRLP